VGEASLEDPLWWPALTRYVAEMHTAWLAFLSAGRLEHHELRIVFTMLAGLAPLHAERLASRGGPTFEQLDPDPLLFYDISSYGPAAVGALADAIGGVGQLLYGSDRPVVEPTLLDGPEVLDWDLLADGAARAFGPTRLGVPRDRSLLEAATATTQSPSVPVARVEALR
jgi:hypothetical protein